MGQTQNKDAAIGTRCMCRSIRICELYFSQCFSKSLSLLDSVDSNQMALFDRTFQGLLFEKFYCVVPLHSGIHFEEMQSIFFPDLSARSTVEGKRNNNAIDKVRILFSKVWLQ